MPQNENRFAIYSRKSRFTGKGESIENQVELCREYIEIHYGTEALERIVVYEDEGFSGGNLNRPDYKKMMDAAKKRKFRTIVVYRLDRISRNISDFAGLIEELSRLDIAFISIKEQFDTGTPMGRAMMYIASVFSQLERETIAERIRDNMHELAKTGRWLGGTTPTGYASETVKNITVDGKTKKACKLKLIAEEAGIVRTIFTLYRETDSLTMTEAELIRREIKTKNGNYFSRFSVRAILQNPVYAVADSDTYDYLVKAGCDLFSEKAAFDGVHGIMAYNRTDQDTGKATRYLPAEEWIVSVGLHPGIIPGKVWVNVQELLERNKCGSYRKPRSNEALLTGVLYCSCGSRMYPKLARRKTEEGKPVYTYVCKMKERSQRSACNQKNVSGNLLDRMVMDQICSLEEEAHVFVQRLRQNWKLYKGNYVDYKEQSLLLKNKIDMDKKIEVLVDSLAEVETGAARSHVAKRIEQLNQERERIDSRIEELKKRESDCAFSSFEMDAISRRLSGFRSEADEMGVEQKRSVIRALVKKVLWDGERAQVTLCGVSEETLEK